MGAAASAVRIRHELHTRLISARKRTDDVFRIVREDDVTATTLAVIVVLIELGLIAWIRHRFMDTPWTSAIFQVVLGGILVFLTGVLIGKAGD